MATLTMEEGLIYKLANTAGVSALVGSRVYGPRFPQGATVPLITVDAWAATEASAKAICSGNRLKSRNSTPAVSKIA